MTSKHVNNVIVCEQYQMLFCWTIICGTGQFNWKPPLERIPMNLVQQT